MAADIRRFGPRIPNECDYDCGEPPRTDHVGSDPTEYRLDGDRDGIACES